LTLTEWVACWWPAQQRSPRSGVARRGYGVHRLGVHL
jgi:hypothetical protein